VVDDASTDKSPAIVEQQFARNVQLIRQSHNRGFGPTMNTAVKAAAGQIIVCLNNDLVAKPPLIRELVKPRMEDSGLFGVSGKTVSWGDAVPNHVSMAARWSNGRLVLTHANSDIAHATMFLQGGCCSMRRVEFQQLGGFSDLYTPGYWEDYDISYAALKAGWQNLYNPAAEAYHFGGGSMSRALGEERLATIKLRNHHLFTLANITDPAMFRQVLARLPAQIAFGAPQRLAVRWGALRGVLARLEELTRVRAERRALQKRTDADIFREFESHGAAG
jgi:GT2 family glycosyltransferase